MKAIVYHDYGSPDVLRYEEIRMPVPKDNEVLIKVLATSVNPLDWHFMRGEPYPLRLIAGLLKPKNTQLGVDVAGWVEAVGAKVTQFKPGDEVFGTCRGAFAEYVCAPESTLIVKPNNVSFEQGASAPIAAFTALQALRRGGVNGSGEIQARKAVLINGASGGVGTFAVQIAKCFGADVTGVCSIRNIQLVRSIGADRVIDYGSTDYTKEATQSTKGYDAIVDCIGNHPLSANRRVLTLKGVYIPVGARAGRWMMSVMARAITSLALSKFGSQTLVPQFLAKSNKEDLTALAELMTSGKIKPVIDKRYKLSEAPDAIRYLEEGHARGKVIISMA
ncbi:MAG: NAD(P)-dependent alcohol dehydrogenase [Terriglobales bacterium]